MTAICDMDVRASRVTQVTPTPPYVPCSPCAPGMVSGHSAVCHKPHSKIPFYSVTGRRNPWCRLRKKKKSLLIWDWLSNACLAQSWIKLKRSWKFVSERQLNPQNACSVIVTAGLKVLVCICNNSCNLPAKNLTGRIILILDLPNRASRNQIQGSV